LRAFRALSSRPIAGAAALLSVCLASGTLADELKTRTGETLIGTIVEEHPEHVVFDSAALGRLRIERKLILNLTREPPPSSPAAAVELLQPAGEPSREPAVAPQTAAGRESGNAVSRFLARINPLKGWDTKLDFGFIARRGDDSDNDLTLRFRSKHETEAGNEHQIEARYYYAEDVFEHNVTLPTDELLTAAYRYRHALTPPFFFQSRSSYYRDAIKELDHEVTQTFGMGVRLKGEKWRLSVTPVVGVRWRQIAGEDGTHVVVGAYQELRFDITSGLYLGQSLDYLIAVDDSDDYSTRLAIELNQKLGEIWSLALRYDYTFDSVVGTGASEEQQRLALTLGLEFGAGAKR
jgi:putative salt-induced outer membrane protein YdiY